MIFHPSRRTFCHNVKLCHICCWRRWWGNLCCCRHTVVLSNDCCNLQLEWTLVGVMVGTFTDWAGISPQLFPRFSGREGVAPSTSSFMALISSSISPFPSTIERGIVSRCYIYPIRISWLIRALLTVPNVGWTSLFDKAATTLEKSAPTLL